MWRWVYHREYICVERVYLGGCVYGGDVSRGVYVGGCVYKDSRPGIGGQDWVEKDLVSLLSPLML